MKKILLPAVTFALVTFAANAQTTIWTEDFNNTCASACSTYSGTNGAWSFVNVGTNSDAANIWYVSESEVGFSTINACGQGGPASNHAGSTGASLHIGAANLMDIFAAQMGGGMGGGILGPLLGSSNDADGATYFAGIDPIAGIVLSSFFPGVDFSSTTSKRAESPTIDLTGRTGLEIKFNYIEGGDGVKDNATLWGFDGTTWTEIADMPKTDTCSTGRGEWKEFTTVLPAYFDNNANAKIGFLWVNDSDGAGTDPSFAVDNIEIFSSALAASFTASNTNICSNEGITFTDASVGPVASWSWTFPTGTPATSNVQNPGQIFFAAGTHTVTLVVSDGTINETYSITVMVNDAPVLTSTSTDATNGNNGTATTNVTGGVGPFSYTWNTTPMQITATATDLAPGTYIVTVSGTNGCSAKDTVQVYDENGPVQSIDEFTKAGMSLYPNPTSSVLNVNLNNIEANELSVFNLLGQKILVQKLNTNTDIVSLNVENLQSGIYILQFNSSAKVYSIRFIKQ